MEHKRKNSCSLEEACSKKLRPTVGIYQDLDQTIIQLYDAPVHQETEVSSMMKPNKIVTKVEEESAIANSKYTDGSYLKEVEKAYRDACQPLRKEVSIPNVAHYWKFAEARASEIATIMKEVTKKRPKLAQQQLPYCMRRKTASLNPKRVPRRLRERALKEIQKAKKNKRPSRKHRRRPKNLLEEYNRRQRKFVWLETHIWFAKRFQMEEIWGYKIPYKPNDKNRRSTFRAISQSAIIQDLSYYCCVELNGTEDVLLSKLSLLTNPEVGMTFAAKMSLNGSREGYTFLYHPNSYPYNAIGPVSFLWKPMIETPVNSEDSQTINLENKVRKLWIWCHPSMHNTVIKAIVDLFGLKEVQSEDGNNHSDSEPSDMKVKLTTEPQNISDSVSHEDIHSVNMETKQSIKQKSKASSKQPLKFTSHITWMKTKPHLQIPPYYENEEVRMTLLKDKLVRHRLIGPKALSILADVLMVADVNCSKDLSVEDKKWWQLYYDESMKSLLYEKEAVWQQLCAFKSSGVSPPKAVVGLTVKDPRLNLPSVKTAVSEDEDADEEDLLMSNHLFTPSIASTALWDEEIRNKVTATKTSESELNNIRSQFLVTEKVLDLGQEESKVPIMVIQQPGINGYGDGWDIIAPVGWSMPFWIACIYRRARVTGLREFKSMHKEMQRPLLPYDFPDTPAGIDTENWDWKQKMTQHYRYPPDKRPSFRKLGVLTPYWMAWGTLVADWKRVVNEDLQATGQSELDNENMIVSRTVDYFVLRNKKQLKLLKDTCDLLRRGHGLSSSPIEKYFQEFVVSIGDAQSHLKDALVLVQLKNLTRGIPHQYSGVYLLDESDVTNFKRKPAEFTVIEPVNKILEAEKKVNKTKGKTAEGTKKSGKNEIDLVKPKLDTIFSENSRKMIGYADGSFCFHVGHGSGNGHCTLIGFLQVLNMSINHKIKPLVLVRAQNSFHYKLCEIEVGNIV